jgi:AcrR family transcriptional regulator
MSAPVKPRRRYDASGRREAARLRRLRILDTARVLFLAEGYPAITVAAIASNAGVSEDLVFRLFGSKRSVLKEVMDIAIGGDDQDIPLLDRTDPQTVRAATDQHEQIRLFAAGMAAQLERVQPLNDLIRSAAVVEPEIAELQQDLHQRQRRFAMNMVASWIAGNGPLRDEMTAEDAGAVIWTLASPEVHRALVVDCAWSSERFGHWLRHMLATALLP